jgi:hypothetical protein
VNVWINNGLVTWLPTLYKQMFQLPLQTSLAYGWITSGVASNMSLLRLRLSRSSAGLSRCCSQSR